MPVAIGNELELQNNKVSAEYGELFRKLNVAKAWTNTTTTESGGTVSVLYGDGNVITNMESGYNDWYNNDFSSYCIINGKLYRLNNGSLNQVGTKSDWIGFSAGNDTNYILAIDSSHDLYYISSITSAGTYSSITEVGAGINWTMIEGRGNVAICVGDNKLYYIIGTEISLISEVEGWQKIVGYIVQNSSTYFSSGLCNGYVYVITKNNISLMNTNNNFIDISGPLLRTDYGYQHLYALNSNGDLYWNNGLELVKSNFNNGKIKQISKIYGLNAGGAVITEDNKLYYSTGGSLSPSWYELGSGMNWTWVCSGTSIILAISNGKLYKITPNTSGGVITQIGATTGYKKVSGYIWSMAWTGNATHTETTVYTTQNPIANDKAYSDTNLTEYSTVQSCTGTTLTDNYRTYQADVAKNSSFTKIPPASIHETVSTIDILRATE